jgi:hypothetical protein
MLWWEDGYDYNYEVDLSTVNKHASKPVTRVVKDLDYSGFAPVTMTMSGELIGAAVGDDQTVLAWVRDSHCILPDWPLRPVADEQLTLTVAGQNQSWQVKFYDGVTGVLLSTVPADRVGGEVQVSLPTFQDSLALILEPAPRSP